MSLINVDYNFKTDDGGVSNNTLQNPIKDSISCIIQKDFTSSMGQSEALEPQTINILNIRTDVRMRRVLSDRPIGKPAQCLACFLFKTWAAERLLGQLSKLQPNQAPCHLSANSASSCQAQECSGTLAGGGNGRHLVWKHNLGKFRWSDVEDSSIHAALCLSE